MNTQVIVPVAIITNDRGQVLLTKRGADEAADAENKWELPGGTLEFHETPEQTVVREVKEETGYDVAIVRMLPKVYTNHWTHRDGNESQIILIPFHCKIIDGKLFENFPDDEIIDAKFVDVNDIGSYDSLPKTKEIIDLLKSQP